MNFARFSHTFDNSHVISALQKAYLSATCICLIKLLWLVSTCFCVQVAHHSKTLVQVCFCFIVCLIPCKRLSFFINQLHMCISSPSIGKQNMFSFTPDFEFCTIFTFSCLQSCYFSLAKGLICICHSTFAKFSYIPALQKAWYKFCIPHICSPSCYSSITKGSFHKTT